MELSILDILYIVDMDGQREILSYVGYGVCAVMLICFLYEYRKYFTERVMRIIGTLFHALFLATLVTPVSIYGSTKRTAVTNFDAKECPDSVTFTWDEVTSGLIVNAVQIERRLKGATEDEAWESWGAPVSGGQKHITIDGFTLDKDYEYRAKYIYTEAVQ